MARIGITNYIIAGREKAGPYDIAHSLTFSPDDKTLAYMAKTDDTLTHYLFIGGTACIGKVCGGHAVYLKDGAIWTR